MPDYNRANTVEDLLRRYNLDGVTKKVTQIQGELVNTNGILEDFVETTTENLDLINDQLDGNVTSWFYDYVPTLLNVPASGWTTDAIKDEHLEDLFYDSSTGKVYKFVKESDTYQWIEVTNIIGAQTFAIANASQDVIDGNRRTFFTTPTPPYDVGDLWADNTNHILYRCLTPKATGETFAAADWIDSLKYMSTDDGDKLINSINSNKTTKTISADKLFIEGDEINMTSKDLSITSTNFQLTKEGNLSCKNGHFEGFITLNDADEDPHLGRRIFQIYGEGYGDYSKYYDYDYTINSNQSELNSRGPYDGTHDYAATLYTSNSGCHVNHTYYSEYSGSTTTVSEENVVIYNVDDPTYTNYQSRMSLYGFTCTDGNTKSALATNGIFVNDYNSNIRCQMTYNGIAFVDLSAMQLIDAYFLYNECKVQGPVTASSFNPLSLEEKKKDIEPLVNGLDIIKNVDIYKYRYKEEDDTKKHIGFVIGDKYKYSEEITNNDNDCADLYSFVSVCCKAIQEQQKEIEELKEEISKLKEGR